MNKANPNKWIRKMVFDAVDGIVVNNEVVLVYDTRVTGPNKPLNYVLMSTQTSDVDKDNKCAWMWDSSILLDITTVYPKPGNPGSRLLNDDITNAVILLINDMELDFDSNFVIYSKTTNITDLNTITDTESVYRTMLRLELRIN